MKSYKLYSCLLLTALISSNCKQEIIGQFPIDNIAPGKVKNVVVENLPGAVNLTYEVPDEDDILYIQAVYDLPTGEKGYSKTSIFSNSMNIKGFGRSHKRTIQLITVDRSKNESEPVNVEIEPLDSPIYGILENMQIVESFGGFKLAWLNALKNEIVVGVLQKDEATKEFSYVDNFYSSAIAVQEAVRGLDSTRATFGIYIRDTYGNYTDTLQREMKPLFEQMIPKSGFVEQRLSSIFTLHSWGGRTMTRLWDNITNIADNVYYIQTGNAVMPFFTFDMGVKAKLSRFRWWQRIDFPFALHNPKEWEWYATNDPAVANNPDDMNWQNNPAWTKIATCISHKPSGDETTTVNTEDMAYAEAGEEFEFPLDTQSYRYLRFKLIKTWSGSSGVHIGELTFWGQIDK